jgi:hypothetical protein
MVSFVFLAVWAVQLGATAPAEPARSPQLATNGSVVGMTYGAGKGIYFRGSRDSGITFGAPVKVAEAEVVPLNRHRGPRIAFSGTTIVIAAVAGNSVGPGAHAHGLPSDGDLLAWRSVDGGLHWSDGVAINDVPGAAREGLHALAADSRGRLFAVWLDQRESAGTRLFAARSIDGGASWSKNVLAYSSPDGTVCECCHPSIAIDPNGKIFVMWRNWLGGSRDMYLAYSQDGERFSNAEKLGLGTWQLNACPMDGGGLAIDKGRPVSAWRREKTLYVAELGARERALGDGKDIAVSAGRKGFVAVWVDSTGLVALPPGATHAVMLSRSGAAPALTALEDGSALAAWEDGGAIKTKRMPQ